MLSPIDVHYLVGLLTKISNPESVNIILGDYVYDIMAEKNRDVDITVTYKDTKGQISAFKGIEVKRHLHPLNVIHVEQLALKLKDMPDLSHRCIVSASGYTKGAIKKAQAHGIELFCLKPWNNTMEGFEHIKFLPEFHINVLKEVLVQGKITWKESKILPEFKILIKDGETKPYVGCAIAEHPNGNLLGFTVSQFDRDLKLVNIIVSDRNREKIRDIKVK
jgi:hypothetical protein